MAFNYFYSYFKTLTVKHHTVLSIIGFLVLITILFQLLSGIMLALSYIPEPMLVPIVRDEEDLDSNYTDDFFWVHERGVDFLFIFIYIHFFRKLYLVVNYIYQEFTWKSGVFTFIFLHFVTFFGLVLCCSHLSDITLSIACNILHTFIFYFKSKIYWLIFTDKSLNTDTLIRMAYLHYILAFFFFFLGILHALDMHYDWKSDNYFDFLKNHLNWLDEVFKKEIFSFFFTLAFSFYFFQFFFNEPETISYELFMWGDIGLINDIRFYGVSPHWYFRSYMAWLTACPMHITGLIGLIIYLVSLYYQPILHKFYNKNIFYSFKLFTYSAKIVLYKFLKINIYPFFFIFFRNYYISKSYKFVSSQIKKLTKPYLYFFSKKKTFINNNLFTLKFFFLFFLAFIYASSFLPCGRYYQKLYGNNFMLFSYIIVFIYLLFPFLKFFLFKIIIEFQEFQLKKTFISPTKYNNFSPKNIY